jgi:hypothetical protein
MCLAFFAFCRPAAQAAPEIDPAAFNGRWVTDPQATGEFREQLGLGGISDDMLAYLTQERWWEVNFESSTMAENWNGAITRDIPIEFEIRSGQIHMARKDKYFGSQICTWKARDNDAVEFVCRGDTWWDLVLVRDVQENYSGIWGISDVDAVIREFAKDADADRQQEMREVLHNTRLTLDFDKKRLDWNLSEFGGGYFTVTVRGRNERALLVPGLRANVETRVTIIFEDQDNISYAADYGFSARLTRIKE